MMPNPSRQKVIMAKLLANTCNRRTIFRLETLDKGCMYPQICTCTSKYTVFIIHLIYVKTLKH